MESDPCELVRNLVSRYQPHVVAGCYLVRRREAHGERSPLQEVLGGLVGIADWYRYLVWVADAAPGCVHYVGSPVLVVCGYHQNRLRKEPVLGTKILSHMQKDYNCKVKQLPGDILIFLQYLRCGGIGAWGAGCSQGKDSGTDLADRENSSIFAGMNWGMV